MARAQRHPGGTKDKYAEKEKSGKDYILPKEASGDATCPVPGKEVDVSRQDGGIRKNLGLDSLELQAHVGSVVLQRGQRGRGNVF